MFVNNILFNKYMNRKELIESLWKNSSGKTVEYTKNGRLPTFKEFEKMLDNAWVYTKSVEFFKKVRYKD